jgi:acylphosphatase
MRYCITIKGRVQGVFFRKHTLEKAKELGIKGFVQNLPDGSVYCEAEGPEDELQWFMDWCSEGSPNSRVTSLEVESKEAAMFTDFEIRK